LPADGVSFVSPRATFVYAAGSAMNLSWQWVEQK